MVVLVVMVVMVVGWLIGLLFLFLEGESLFLIMFEPKPNWKIACTTLWRQAASV